MEAAQPQRTYKTTLAQRQAAKRWRDKFPERDAERKRRWWIEISADPDTSRLERQRTLHRSYYAQNKDTYREANNRHRNTPNAKIADRMRGMLRSAMKKGKRSRIEYYLGCPIEGFRYWIACQFTGGMSWENHGVLWELDHIRPCARFDLTTEQGKLECFHFTNTRPLLRRENQIKHAKVA